MSRRSMVTAADGARAAASLALLVASGLASLMLLWLLS